MSSNRGSSKAPDALQKGQIWITPERRLEVKHVGKHLVEFVLTPHQAKGGPKPRGFTQCKSVLTVLEFLRSRKAVLTS